MNLKEYLEKNNIPTILFAEQTGLGLTSVYRYMRGGVPNRLAAKKIFEFTEGQVDLPTRKDKRLEKYGKTPN